MKKGPIVLIMLAVILLGLFSGLTLRPVEAATIQFYEGQVTANSASQTNPDIDGNNIVYQDNRSGNWDIYMYTLQPTWTPEARITTNPANQINPKIYGDTIVYQDDRNGNWDIYMYNITSHVETQITNNTADQINPDIYANRIVWQDNRDGYWDIYIYDLSTHAENRVTSKPSQNAAISGNRIVYEQSIYYAYAGYVYPGTHIFEVDLSTGQTIDVDISNYPGSFYGQYGALNGYYNQVLFGPAWSTYQGPLELSSPVISGNIVAFRDQIAGWIYITDLTTLIRTQISYTHTGQYPSICENQPGVYYIVYQDNRNGNWDIYLYNTLYTGTSTPTEFRVTNSTASQENPAVSNGRIVYQDNRNGNWDIYMTTVGYAAQAGLPIATPVAAIKNIQAVKNIIAQISTSDIDGANSNVKENRRTALLNKLDAAIASVQAAADSTDSASRIMNAQSAIDQLSSVLDKADGWVLRGAPDTAGSGYTPDWIITTSASQATQIYGLKGSITMLQTLLQLK